MALEERRIDPPAVQRELCERRESPRERVRRLPPASLLLFALFLESARPRASPRQGNGEQFLARVRYSALASFVFPLPPPATRMNPRAARARRPEAAPIKLDGDVRAAAVSRDAEARRSSSRLAGPFSRSLSAVMECINIGEPAGPPTDAPCTLRARPFASNNRGGRCRDTSRGMEYSYKPPLRCKPPGPAH